MNNKNTPIQITPKYKEKHKATKTHAKLQPQEQKRSSLYLKKKVPSICLFLLT